MRIRFSQNRKNIVFEADPYRPQERTLLQNFPGTYKDAPGVHWCPAKPNIAYNIVNRLRKKCGKVMEIDPDVKAMLDAPFKLKEIPADFEMIYKPLRHQEIALRYFYTVGGGGILLDPGLGKTKVVLDGIKLCGFKKSLIVCPKALLFVWEDEVAKHRPDLSVYVLESTAWGVKIKSEENKPFNKEKTTEQILKEGKYPLEERLPVLEERFYAAQKRKVERIKKAWAADRQRAMESDIVVVNYDKVVVGQYYLEKMGFDFIAVDEGLIKDPKTERTKAVTYLGQHIPNRCIMSGTLVNNSPLDVFAPVRFLEPSLTGQAFGKFRDRYCDLVYPDKRQNPNSHKSFVVGYKDTDEVRGILESTSIVMTKDEWLDLPDKKFHRVICPMSQEQQDHFESLAANYVTQLGDRFVEVDSPLTMMSKLSQISNGFMYFYDDDGVLAELDGSRETPKRKISDRETAFFRKQPKIEKLRAMLKEELRHRKFILWYNMSAECTLIEEMLREEGINYATIKGGEKDTGGKVRMFNNDPEQQVLVCQARAVNYGITVLGVSGLEMLERGDIEVLPEIDTQVYTQVFYSLNYSLELFIQQQDRCHRIGQEREVDYYILISDNEADRSIMDKLELKKSIREDILVDIIEKIRRKDE